jgi:pyruvate/2-oxoglutarate dehydrogenase complex dihydrolipoamide dehydrogenase (E3) component
LLCFGAERATFWSQEQKHQSGSVITVRNRKRYGGSRAVEKGETHGFIKISVDTDTKHILGAAILGTGGDEVIHVLLDVMYAKAPYTIVQRANAYSSDGRGISPHYHVQTGSR